MHDTRDAVILHHPSEEVPVQRGTRHQRHPLGEPGGQVVVDPDPFTHLPGISERMLSDRLTELAAAGLVVREVYEGPPLRVVYRLTEAGAALEPALTELGGWARTYLGDGDQSGTCG
jgi:hypothetical protein